MKTFKQFIKENAKRIKKTVQTPGAPDVDVKIPGPSDNYSAGRFNALQPTIKSQDRTRKGLVTKSWQQKNLTTQDVRVDDKGTTAKIRTHNDAAENFKRGLEGLRDAGMPLNPKSIQSYNNRTIRNSKNLSSHGTGGAIDVGDMKGFEKWGDRSAADWVKKNPEKYHGVLKDAGLADGSVFTNKGKTDPGHIEAMKSQNPMQTISKPWKDREQAVATGATKTPGAAGTPSGPSIQRRTPQLAPKPIPGLPGTPSGPTMQRPTPRPSPVMPMSQNQNVQPTRNVQPKRNIQPTRLSESKKK